VNPPGIDVVILTMKVKEASCMGASLYFNYHGVNNDSEEIPAI
jgi:hypothetical protein